MSQRPAGGKWRCGLLGLTVLCAALWADSAPAAQVVWLKLETVEFVAYSDAPQKELIECGLNYAAYRRAFSSLFLEPGQSLPPSTLILFRRANSFQDHVPRQTNRNSTIVNYSAEVDGTSMNTFALTGDRDRALALTFEFETVWALRRVGYNVPVWMSQGAGEVLSTLRLRKGKCWLGAEGDHANESSIEWKRFFEIGESSPEYTDFQRLGGYLAQAWGLMHWILLKDDGTRERCATLAGRLSTMPALAAVAAVMETPPDQFDRAIKAHLRHWKDPREIAFVETAVRAGFTVIPAPEAEVMVQKSNILGASNRLAESDAQLDLARALAPDLPAVKEAFARRMMREGRTDEAVELYREAITSGSKNFAAYMLSANRRLNDASTGGKDFAGAGGQPATTAVEELRQAVKLNPASAEAYRLLGRAFFVLPQISEADVAELSKGSFSGDAGQPVRLYRALLYSRLGRRDDYLAELRQIAHDPEISTRIRESVADQLTTELLNADIAKVETFATAKNYAAAREVIAVALPNAENEKMAERYRHLSSWVDEAEAWDKIKELSDAQRWAELHDAAQNFAAKFPRSRQAALANKIILRTASQLAEATH
jgi:hypothetical protein